MSHPLLRPFTGESSGPRFRLGAVALLAIAAVWVLSRGYTLTDDSGGYLDRVVFRTPLYPLLLATCGKILGEHQLPAALTVQLLIVLAGIYALVSRLRTDLRLRDAVSWAVILALLFPIVGPPRAANRILPEALAYALVLLAFERFLAAVRTRDSGRFGVYCLWAALGMLARPQLLFLHALSLAGVLYLTLRGTGRRTIMTAVGLWMAFALFAVGADRAYHSVVHGRFVNIPFSGIQLVAQALYVSQPGDERFLDPRQADLFLTVRAHADAKGLLASANPVHGGLTRFADHHRQSYNRLVWGTLVPDLEQAGILDSERSAEGMIAVDRTLLPIASRLIRARPGGYLHLLAANVVRHHGTAFLVFLVLATATLAWRSVAADDWPATVALFTLIAHFANVGLIVLVEPLHLKYSFYTESILVAALFLCLAAPLFAREGDSSDPRR